MSRVSRKLDWPALFDTLCVQILILDPRKDKELLETFQSEADWRVTYCDTEGAVLARPEVSMKEGIPVIRSLSAHGLAR